MRYQGWNEDALRRQQQRDEVSLLAGLAKPVLADVPKPISRLGASMAQLEAAATELQKAIDSITDRLNPVLTPAGVESQGDKGACSEVNRMPAPLVAHIEKQTMRLRNSLEALRGLERRLEL